uniref:CCHC-type domain-containing protein n=1 Tax=Eptatretus burgeri TaxID=7764 RepID=A0A8C4WZD8_EPTBU
MASSVSRPMMSASRISFRYGKHRRYSQSSCPSRMNKRVVIFVSETELVHEILSTGLSTDDGHFVLVSSLDTRAVKVMISNAPPFLRNQTLISERSRYGSVVSQITMLPLRRQDDRTKHGMSFRRQAYVVLPPSNAERTLNIVLKLKIDNHDYQVYVTTDTLKCFECGNFGHLKRSCPKATSSNDETNLVNKDTSSSSSTVKEANPVSGNNAQSSQPDSLNSKTNVWDGFTQKSINPEEKQHLQMRNLSVMFPQLWLTSLYKAYPEWTRNGPGPRYLRNGTGTSAPANKFTLLADTQSATCVRWSFPPQVSISSATTSTCTSHHFMEARALSRRSDVTQSNSQVQWVTSCRVS